MAISQYQSPAMPMDSPLYATPKVFQPATYSKGDFGPPIDGIEYRQTYDPKSGEYVRRGTMLQVSGLGTLSQPEAPMLSLESPLNLESLPSPASILAQAKEWYWPSMGFTWKTAALWAATVWAAKKIF